MKMVMLQLGRPKDWGRRAWTSRFVDDDDEPKLSMGSRISRRSGQTNQWNFSKLFRLVVYAILISEGLSCRSEGAASDGQQSAAAATLPSYVVLTRPPQPQITSSSLRSEGASTECHKCACYGTISGSLRNLSMGGALNLSTTVTTTRTTRVLPPGKRSWLDQLVVAGRSGRHVDEPRDVA
jgi:hypothetical protein